MTYTFDWGSLLSFGGVLLTYYLTYVHPKRREFLMLQIDFAVQAIRISYEAREELNHLRYTLSSSSVSETSATIATVISDMIQTPYEKLFTLAIQSHSNKLYSLIYSNAFSIANRAAELENDLNKIKWVHGAVAKNSKEIHVDKALTDICGYLDKFREELLDFRNSHHQRFLDTGIKSLHDFTRRRHK